MGPVAATAATTYLRRLVRGWVRSYRKILETIAAEKVGDGKLGDKVIKFDILGMADEVPMTTTDGALRATGP